MIVSAIIVSLFALSIISIDLALSVVLEEKRHLAWSRWFIVFIASLLALSLLFSLDLLSSLFWSGLTRKVMHLVWSIAFILDSTFLCVFSVLFCSWLIAIPVSAVVKAFSYLLGSLYFTVSILDELYSSLIFYRLKYSFACLVILYIAFIILFNYRKIEVKRVKILSLTLVIITFSTLPVMILAMVFPPLAHLSISFLGLSFYIAFMVFLFLAVKNDEKRNQRREEKNLKKYGITPREEEVILLIKKGLSNKEIASKLSISVNTVNNHVANIFSKTGTKCRIDLLNTLKEAAW